ncbi:MAG: Crp/Fnr family transcriptional regulator [Janthinobacterium lividum]
MSQETDILQRVPLFAGLPAEALAALAGRLRRRKMPPNTPVVYKGDPSGALYLIASGQVKVHQATSGGDEVILNVLGPGDFFGEMSLIDGQPRSADISTLESVELLLLEGDALRETINEQPAVAWTLLQILTQRLRDQNERTEMLMTRDVAGRVADCLLRLAKSQGVPQPDGKSICVDVSLTQSDIAALIGATRERVSRALSTFRTSGTISWNKETGRWIICKPAALEKRAQM